MKRVQSINYPLVLTFSCKNITRIKRIFQENKSIRWLYLGKDFYKKRHIEQELGNQFRCIDIARLQNEVARDIRSEHVHWIDDMNRRYGKKLEWWFGSISSRNIYGSNLFQYCCYLEILERLWVSQEEKPILVVIESLGLAQTIKKWASKKNIAVKTVNYSWVRHGRLASYFVSFLKWNYFFVILLLRWMAAYITRQMYKPKDLNIKPSVIVRTYMHDYSLSDDDTFKDRYFPYLHEYLFKKGMHVLVHPVLFGFRFNYLSIYKRMRKSSTHFIVREDFLRFSDYLSALVYPLKVLRQKMEAPPFRNFDILDLLKEEQRGQSLTSGLQAVLIYRLLLRLKKVGLQPKQVITWYENQVIDKALIAGSRQAFPHTMIIGAQMLIHSPNWLNKFPSQSEFEAQITPDILLETGQYQCQVAQSFTKSIPCRTAAALRYSHLFNDENIPSNDYNVKLEIQSILVLLPFNVDEAVELLEILNEVLNQISNDIRILIKGHPDYDSKTLVQSFGENNWPMRFEIFQGNLSGALKQASIVISSNSSAMVEAAVKGIPVIFVGSQTVLSRNELSNLNIDMTTECFFASELLAAINKYLNLSLDKTREYREMGKKLRDLYFEPVNDKTMLAFLGIEE